MLAVMEAQQNTAGTSSSDGGNKEATTPDNRSQSQEFLSSGRTGRRNALPNIMGENAVVSSSDLPDRLKSLTTSESKPEDTKDQQPGTSGS